MAENTVGNLDYKCLAQSLDVKRFKQTNSGESASEETYNQIDSEVSAEFILKSLQQ